MGEQEPAKIDPELEDAAEEAAEAEQAAVSANAHSTLPVSHALVEDTIQRNQRMIVATLVDLLAALKKALQASRTLAVTKHLLESTCFWRIFEIFDPSNRRLHSLLNEALEIFRAALAIQKRFTSAAESQQSSEKSQDYGDFTALQEFASTQTTAGRTLTDILHSPLAQQVSDIFGADISIDDTLAVKIIDVWVVSARAMVAQGTKSFSNYINDYNPHTLTYVMAQQAKQKRVAAHPDPKVTVVTGLTTITRPDYFKGPVASSLPYVRIKIEVPSDYEAILMDAGRLIGLHVS